MKRIIALLVLFTLLLPLSESYAGIGVGYYSLNHPVRFGNTTANVYIQREMGLDLLVPLRFTDDFVIEPSFSFSRQQKGSLNFIIFQLGSTFRYYLDLADRMPYLGLHLGAIRAGEPPRVDVDAGMVFGAEYFFNQQVSLGIESQLNVRAVMVNQTALSRTYIWTTPVMIASRLYF